MVTHQHHNDYTDRHNLPLSLVSIPMSRMLNKTGAKNKTDAKKRDGKIEKICNHEDRDKV